MKKTIIFLFVLALVWSCSPSLKTRTTKNHTTINIDSTEYEITIIDPEFDQWYTMRYSAARDLSNEIYRSKNQFAVSNWNSYFNQGHYSRVINNPIYYNSFTNYGIEVNRKLYWYFQYIEETYKVPLFH